MAHHRVDPNRVYVAGLSAGGAMAAILGDTYPDLYAAVGVHSGLAPGSALDLPSALSAMKAANGSPRGVPSGVPTIVFHGDADATVHLRNGEHVIAACIDATASTELTVVGGPGVRKATRAIYRDAMGRIIAERWTVHGAAHAWSGGRALGSYTDGRGPDASSEMLRFFFEHSQASSRSEKDATSWGRA
jgi:poly(3-hydroxybutyrate) depolymerase